VQRLDAFTLILNALFSASNKQHLAHHPSSILCPRGCLVLCSLKCSFWCGGSRPQCNSWFLDPHMFTPQHFDRLIHFCRTHDRDRQTHTQTTLHEDICSKKQHLATAVIKWWSSKTLNYRTERFNRTIMSENWRLAHTFAIHRFVNLSLALSQNFMSQIFRNLSIGKTDVKNPRITRLKVVTNIDKNHLSGIKMSSTNKDAKHDLSDAYQSKWKQQYLSSKQSSTTDIISQDEVNCIAVYVH